MAWPTPSLDDAVLSNNSNGKKWLHALCLALNERQGCFGVTKTQFKFCDGSEAADPDLSDFEDLWIGGTRDGAITNLNRCMTGLKALMTHNVFGLPNNSWKQTSGSSGSDWTQATLEADIGLGAFANTADGWTDLTFWKQMKEAFDRLIYAQKKLAAVGSQNFRAATRTTGSPDFATPQDTWTAALAVSPSSQSYDFHMWKVDRQASYTQVTFINGPTTFNFNTVGMSGTITESYYVVGAGGLGYYDASNPGGWSVGADTYATTGSETLGALLSTSNLALNSLNTKSFGTVNAPPATIPSGSGTFVSILGRIQQANIYFDIASQLTDQA